MEGYSMAEADVLCKGLPRNYKGGAGGHDMIWRDNPDTGKREEYCKRCEGTWS
ncbi:MAG: hypothetical protein AAB955_02600 [Patescibacteria group bacterium]